VRSRLEAAAMTPPRVGAARGPRQLRRPCRRSKAFTSRPAGCCGSSSPTNPNA